MQGTLLTTCAWKIRCIPLGHSVWRARVQCRKVSLEQRRGYVCWWLLCFTPHHATALEERHRPEWECNVEMLPSQIDPTCQACPPRPMQHEAHF
jgi:hypothetical protein